MAKDSTRNGIVPAFPAIAISNPEKAGLTKREWMATICLQGILANKEVHKYTIWSATQSAIMYADQLLVALETAAPAEGGLPSPEPSLTQPPGPGRAGSGR